MKLSKILSSLQKKYQDSIQPKAISIFTPFSHKVPLSKLDLEPETIKFIQKYEPRVLDSGLFQHQFNILDAYSKGAENFILTSTTGSGKSLCFWAWIIDRLTKDTDTTAILCFPTQALMWGQANRLAKISINNSLKIYDTKSKIAYSGTLDLGNRRKIGWTVWKSTGHGVTVDSIMKNHEKTNSFKSARIRIATLDKAHWSLIGRHTDFTKSLGCVVLDEAHQYDGIFGANVSFFFKRLFIAKEVAGYYRPDIFLSSATLSDAKLFASKLISTQVDEIYYESDTKSPEIKSVTLEDAKKLLENPPSGGLSRIAIFIDSVEKGHDLSDLLTDIDTIGSDVNVVYFSESKFESRIIKRDSDSKSKKKRSYFIYDADLTPTDRRRIESIFNKEQMTGGTIIATNALELGVDIENLDICLLNKVPPKRVNLIQRIGRVGRREFKPGLIFLNLSVSPIDRYIATNPIEAFSFDNSKPTPIPTELEMIQLKHMQAAHYEGCFREYANENWSNYKNVFKHHFGRFLDKDQITDLLGERYAGLVDMEGTYWVHKGFRASASEGKIPLRKKGHDRDDVAWIEDVNIFRDAHPEAVYLDANVRRWRVVEYDGNWKQAKWQHPGSEFILAKYLKSIDVVYVEEEKKLITTRGEWEQEYKSYQLFPEPPSGVEYPSVGEIEFGIWEYFKKFLGYKEIDLSTNQSTLIPLTDITNRFKNAINQGRDFPFLFPLSYRTYGWEWKFPTISHNYNTQEIEDFESLIGDILIPYVADIIQANPANIQTEFSLSQNYLRVLDANPGGNGLSEALLQEGRMSKALDVCLESLLKIKKNKKQFKNYLLQLCQRESKYEASEITGVINQLKDYWSE